MKKLIIGFLLIAAPGFAQFIGTVGAGGVAVPDTFKFDIETENEDDSFTLPIYDGGTYNFTVDWGDESSSEITAWNDGDNPHTYEDDGVSTYTIRITGVIDGWRFNNGGDADLVTVIKNWGCLQLGNGGDYFSGCGNLTVTATDQLILSGITDMSNAFQFNLFRGPAFLYSQLRESKLYPVIHLINISFRPLPQLFRQHSLPRCIGIKLLCKISIFSAVGKDPYYHIRTTSLI